MSDKYVLLIEDNPDDVALTEMAFRQCRIQDKLVVVWDGEEALDFLFNHESADGASGRKPDLILLDLKMPCMSGLEVLREIRADERTRSLPVVVLTSSVEDADEAESYLLGANSFFVKPVEFSEFILLVQKLGSEWLDSK